MEDFELLDAKELPAGFEYPREFRHLVELKLFDLEPWYLIGGAILRETLAGLTKRYSSRKLVPFARRQDNDDIACWQVGVPNQIIIIHDFASPGSEENGTFPSFYDWFRRAIEDLIEFDN